MQPYIIVPYEIFISGLHMGVKSSMWVGPSTLPKSLPTDRTAITLYPLKPFWRIGLKILYEERVSQLQLYIFKPLHNSYGPRVNCERSFSALHGDAFSTLVSAPITRIHVLVQFLLTNISSKT